MCETANIRDVIAFPKSQNGKDLMALAPAKVPDEDLIHYKIKCLE
jgi:aspartyl-tRNA synthetase